MQNSASSPLNPVSSANPVPAIIAQAPQDYRTPQQREAVADRAFAQLIKRCGKWEKHESTVKTTLYKHLESCAKTLAVTQDNTMPAWFEASATRTIIKDRYKNVPGNDAFDEKDINSLAQAIIFLAFPSTHYKHLPKGKARNRARQRDWQYTTAIKAASNAQEAHRAAQWFEEQGGIKAVAKAYQNPTDDHANQNPNTTSPSVPSTQPGTVTAGAFSESPIGQATFSILLSDIPDGEWTVLIVKKNGNERDIYAEIRDNKLLKHAFKSAGVTLDTGVSSANDDYKEVA